MQQEVIFCGSQLNTYAIRTQYILSRLEYHPFNFKNIGLWRHLTSLGPIYSHNLLDYRVEDDDIDRCSEAFSRASNSVILLVLIPLISNHHDRDFAALADFPDRHRAIQGSVSQVENDNIWSPVANKGEELTFDIGSLPSLARCARLPIRY